MQPLLVPEYSENLKNTARNAPKEPGVYIWKDEENRIIYVGKAKSLKNRLANYFSAAKDTKTSILMRHARSIETIIVSNEYEALLLENTLIKQHSPKYNINLKDGKTYPVIRISSGDFPRIWKTRHIVEDGSLYFGPYPNIQSVERMLGLIEKLFPLRKCKRFKKRETPCIYYHIGRCMAPCCGKINTAEYEVQLAKVKRLLSGETDGLIEEIKNRMNEEAAALRFEEAAKLRNELLAIEVMGEPQSVEDRDPEDRDYIAWAREGVFTSFSVFSMRAGRMTGRELFSSRSAADETETLETFITAYYSPEKKPPEKIYLQKIENNAAISETIIRFFNESFGINPVFPEAVDKRHTAVLLMARQNSQEELRRRIRERGAGPALDELKSVLDLKNRPETIEGFDIAQLGGRHTVASLISFKNGIPDKKNYRYFKLRTVAGITDDFAAMREVIFRRYSRLLREGKELPDLILVDGGAGQVSAAFNTLAGLGINNCDLAGLAKREEEIWLPKKKKPVKLPEHSEALKILQYVRNETHRFATGLNQKLRSKDLYFPVLESIEGIGPKRAALIMKTFGSLENIRNTEAEIIAEKAGIDLKSAKAIIAAARIALEDKKIKVINADREFSIKELAAFAAEDQPEYN